MEVKLLATGPHWESDEGYSNDIKGHFSVLARALKYKLVKTKRAVQAEG